MDEYPNTTNYSAHFTLQELACRCGCITPPQVNANLGYLAVHLEELRALVGGPLHIDDAYRCPTRNAAVGGVPDSQHLQGKAADINQGNLTVAQLAHLAADVPKFNLGGIGMYPTEQFVHVDYRGNGPARWDENHVS